DSRGRDSESVAGVGVGVVRNHVNGDAVVLVLGAGVGHGGGTVVRARQRDRQGGAARAAVTVADAVADHDVRALACGEVVVGGARLVHDLFADFPCATHFRSDSRGRDSESVAGVGIRVVRNHVDGDAVVLVLGAGVGH